MTTAAAIALDIYRRNSEKAPPGSFDRETLVKRPSRDGVPLALSYDVRVEFPGTSQEGR